MIHVFARLFEPYVRVRAYLAPAEPGKLYLEFGVYLAIPTYKTGVRVCVRAHLPTLD